MTQKRMVEDQSTTILSEACKSCKELVGSENPECELHRFRTAAAEMAEQIRNLRGIVFASDEDCLLAATLLLSEVDDGSMIDSGDVGILKASLEQIQTLVRHIKKKRVQ